MRLIDTLRVSRLLGIAAVAFVAACGDSSVSTAASEDAAGEILVIETGDGAQHEFRVEVAATPEERARGLMFRTELAPDAGMLFQYEIPHRITMWMANTYLPLDMMFIDADGRVINIAERTVPETTTSIPSNGPAIAVLEVNAGTADRLGIARGDLVRHPFFAAP